MNPLPFIPRLKMKIASIGWKLFIWGNDYTEESYWEQIYQQEKAYHENKGGN